MTYLNKAIKFHRKKLYKDAVIANKKRPHRLNKDGIFVPHCYSEPTSTLSWWDDCGFVHHNRFIMVWWVHPRMAYQDQIEDLTYEQCKQLSTQYDCRQLYTRTPNSTSIFARTKKIYKKTGNSRKKVWGYEVLPDPARELYSCCYKIAREKIIKQDNGIIIEPSAKIEVLNWCQGVELVIPEEVLCEDDLIKLVNIARSVVDGNIDIINRYSSYSYDNWTRDSALQETENNGNTKIINT